MNNLENERRPLRVFRNESSASGNKIAVLFSNDRSARAFITRTHLRHTHTDAKHTCNIRRITRTVKRQGDCHFFSNDTESLCNDRIIDLQYQHRRNCESINFTKEKGNGRKFQEKKICTCQSLRHFDL